MAPASAADWNRKGGNGQWGVSSGLAEIKLEVGTWRNMVKLALKEINGAGGRGRIGARQPDASNRKRVRR